MNTPPIAPWNADIARSPSMMAEPQSVDVEVVQETVGKTLKQAQRLLDGYVELIKYDVREELTELRTSLVFTLIAVFGGGTTLLLLCFAGAYGLASMGLSLSLAFAASGLGAALFTGCVALVARKMLAPIDVEAIPEAKEDTAWIKDNV